MNDIGVSLYHNEEVVGIQKAANGDVTVTLQQARPVTTTTLLYAVGRVGACRELNLERAGLAADSRGRLTVNEHFQTSVPHIYAVGDIIGFPALASTSMQQGRHASCHAFGQPDSTDTALLPYGIYSIPEISMVGRTEEDLAHANIPVGVGVARYREIARGQIIGDETGMLKLLFHRQTRERRDRARAVAHGPSLRRELSDGRARRRRDHGRHHPPGRPRGGLPPLARPAPDRASQAGRRALHPHLRRAASRREGGAARRRRRDRAGRRGGWPHRHDPHLAARAGLHGARGRADHFGGRLQGRARLHRCAGLGSGRHRDGDALPADGREPGAGDHDRSLPRRGRGRRARDEADRRPAAARGAQRAGRSARARARREVAAARVQEVR